MDQQRSQGLKKYLSLGCAMSVHLMVGSYYMYSNMYIYVSHYLRKTNPQMDEAGKDAQVVMPIWLIFQSLVSILSVRLCEKIGFKIVNCLAFGLFTLNNLAMIWIDNYYTYIAVYGVSNGVAIGLGYLPGMYTTWTHFPDKKSVVTGLVLFCAGMSASITSPLVTMIVNPNNVDPSSKEVVDRVPMLFTYLTVIYGTITLFACSLLPPPFKSQISLEKKELRNRIKRITKMEKSGSPNGKQLEDIKQNLRRLSSLGNLVEDRITDRDVQRMTRNLLTREFTAYGGIEALIANQLEPEDIEDLVLVLPKEDAVARATEAFKTRVIDLEEPIIESEETDDLRTQIIDLSKSIQEQGCPTFATGLLSRSFLMLAIMAFSAALYNYFILTAWKAIFKHTLDLKDGSLANILIIGAIANSVCRIFAGFLLLRFSFKQLYISMNLLIVFTTFTFDLFVMKPKNQIIGLIYLFIGFGCLGFMITIFPTTCVKVFGSEFGPKLYPCIFIWFSFASLAAYSIYGRMTNYVHMFNIFGTAGAVGLVVSIFFDQNPKWKK